MLAQMMRLRCAGYGAKTTTYDGLKGAGVILGGTLLSVLVATWMRRRAVEPAYTQALMTNGWLVSFVISMRYTTLKGWPGRTQAIFISVLLMLVVLLALGVAWISSRGELLTPRFQSWSCVFRLSLQDSAPKRGRRLLSERADYSPNVAKWRAIRATTSWSSVRRYSRVNRLVAPFSIPFSPFPFRQYVGQHRAESRESRRGDDYFARVARS